MVDGFSSCRQGGPGADANAPKTESIMKKLLAGSGVNCRFGGIGAPRQAIHIQYGIVVTEIADDP